MKKPGQVEGERGYWKRGKQGLGKGIERDSERSEKEWTIVMGETDRKRGIGIRERAVNVSG